MSSRPAFVTTQEHSDRLREKRCGSKIQYSGERVAYNATVLLSWLHPALGGMEPYHCEYCDYYHVGHPFFRMANGREIQAITQTIRVRRIIRREKDED